MAVLTPQHSTISVCVVHCSTMSKVNTGCQKDTAAAYRYTGAVCRLTLPAAAVLNEKTTKVIEAAFQHAKYPSVKAEKSILFVGTVKYGLANLEINNLSIGRSDFDLLPGEGISMEIVNVSAVFRGTIEYGYGNWLLALGHSVDFEIDAQIDLGINPKLYCGKDRVAADTSDCYLNFHKLHLMLQGDREPGWLKRLFTEFITFTVKLVIKGQICKEINNVANILADFIQEQAEQFLSDGNISMDIGVTAAPVITANYVESYHKGLTKYNGTSAVINESLFHPSHLREERMLYFWISDEVFNPMLVSAYKDGRFKLNISGDDLTELFTTNLTTTMPEVLSQCLWSPGPPELWVRSVSVPQMKTSPLGTNIKAVAAVELSCGDPDTPGLSFETEVEVLIKASYADKKLGINALSSQVSIVDPSLNQTLLECLQEAIEKIGIPKVISVLEPVLTRLMDRQGLYLFDLIDPIVEPQDGFVLIQMDFGFPHHLLVEFLRKTLQ
ncbi:cholesteryl ester transfer protein [Aplochiton taeniatus]